MDAACGGRRDRAQAQRRADRERRAGSRLDQPVDEEDVGVEQLRRRLRPAASGARVGEQARPGASVLVCDRPGGQPDLAQEHVAVGQPETGGDLVLQVQPQLVVRRPALALVGQHEVQRAAGAQQRGAGAHEVGAVGGAQVAGADEGVEGGLAEHARRGPAQAPEVPQGADAVLEVRLQETQAEASMALRVGLGQPVQDLAAVLGQPAAVADREVVEQPGLAGDQPPVHERGRGVDAVASGAHRVLGRAHGVPDRQPRVPERVADRAHEALEVPRLPAVVQEEQVDVGLRAELAAGVAAQRDDGDAPDPLAPRQLREPAADRGVDGLRPRAAPLGPRGCVDARMGERRVEGVRGRPARARRCGCARPPPAAAPRPCRRRSCPCGPTSRSRR